MKIEVIANTIQKQYCLFILNRVSYPTEFIPIAEGDDIEFLERKAKSMVFEKGQWWHIVDKYSFAIVKEGKVS